MGLCVVRLLAGVLVENVHGAWFAVGLALRETPHGNGVVVLNVDGVRFADGVAGSQVGWESGRHRLNPGVGVHGCCLL